mmetsp:Transcript_39839/g.98505  ORF Transcript_39839/g.98505 Transcript_39839/m.98505 type:complete len:208 (+) Transcript_39839:2286-2909(+)
MMQPPPPLPRARHRLRPRLPALRPQPLASPPPGSGRPSHCAPSQPPRRSEPPPRPLASQPGGRLWPAPRIRVKRVPPSPTLASPPSGSPSRCRRPRRTPSTAPARRGTRQRVVGPSVRFPCRGWPAALRRASDRRGSRREARPCCVPADHPPATRAPHRRRSPPRRALFLPAPFRARAVLSPAQSGGRGSASTALPGPTARGTPRVP